MLVGGVTRSRRIRENFRTFLERHGMGLVEIQEDDALFFEALGCALVAAERPGPLPTLDALSCCRGETTILKGCLPFPTTSAASGAWSAKRAYRRPSADLPG